MGAGARIAAIKVWESNKKKKKDLSQSYLTRLTEIKVHLSQLDGCT